MSAEVRRPGERAEREVKHFVRSVISGVIVAVDAHAVLSIADMRELDERGEAPVDLALLLGLPVPEGEVEARRVLRVAGARGSKALIVGEGARISAIPLSELRPFPRFLSGLARRAGLSGLFVEGEQIGFILDVSRLGAPGVHGERA